MAGREKENIINDQITEIIAKIVGATTKSLNLEERESNLRVLKYPLCQIIGKKEKFYWRSIFVLLLCFKWIAIKCKKFGFWHGKIYRICKGWISLSMSIAVSRYFKKDLAEEII